MSELETAIVIVCGLFGWVAALHWKINGLRDAIDEQLILVRGLDAEVSRLQREVRR